MFIKQINLNKSKLANDNLCHLFSLEKKHAIYLVTEPFYFKNRLCGIPKGFKTFGEKNSRAIIIAHESIDLIYCNELSTKDITVCLNNSSKRYFASIYLDILEDPIHPYLTKMADFFTISNCNAILGIDSNSHSEAFWNSLDTNSRGQKLEEFILSYDMAVLNKGNVATFKSTRYESIIDITLAIGVTNDIESWHVITDYQFSDHRMISFKVGATKTYKKLMPKTDWSKFKETVKFEPVSYPQWDYSTIEIESKKIEEILNSAIKKCTRFLPVKSFRQAWWSNELQNAKQEVKRLYVLHDRNPTVETEEALKSAKKSFKKDIRRAKRSSWREFCEAIESPKTMAKLNKVITHSSQNEIGLLKNIDGVYAKSVNETINILMNTHLPGCEPSTNQNEWMEDNVTCDQIIYDMNFESFITEEKVKLAFNSFSPDKTPGLCGIKPKALQLIGDDGIKRITNLYKACVEIGYTPKRMRESKLIFIAKPGKDDYSNARSFRPIALMSFLFKALEKLVLWEIEENTLSKNPLSKDQHAFVRSRNTDTILSAQIDDIERAILRNQIGLAVFCDIMGAFDSIKISSAIKAMEEKNFPPKLIRWFKQYLENRYAETSLQGETVRKKLIKGCQQGSCTGPLIWNLIMDSFLSLHKGAVLSRGFADDGILLILGLSPIAMVDLMQVAINKTVQWGIKFDLIFQPQKTNAMFFHRKNKWKDPQKRLIMSGIPIEYSKTVKWLGIHLDQKLHFKVHVDKKILSAKKHIMLLKNAISSTWGPNPRLIKWMYNAIILPSLCYGSVIWSRACSTKNVKDKLTKLNRLIACCMMPFRKSTPSEGLEVVLDLPPIDLKVEQLALKTMLRVIPLSNPKWDGLGKGSFIGHLRWGTNKLKDMGIDPFNNDSTHSSLNISRNFTVDQDSYKSGQPVTDSTTICYTDGSRMKNQSGFGLGITRGDLQLASKNGQLGSNATVFQAEVFAIHQASELLKEMGTKNVTIFSDSQSALSALAGVKIKSIVVKNCIEQLNELGKTSHVELKWIKSHSGFVGNELADSLAKIGTTNVENKVNLPSPKSFAIGKISNAMYKAWNQRWVSSNDYRQTKIWFPVVNTKKSNILLRLSRHNLGLMIQTISGHNRLNYHESKINPQEDATCRLCQWEAESSWHLVGECPALWRSRLDIFNLDILDEPPEWTVIQLLKFIQKTKLHMLLNGGSTIPLN